MDRKEKIELLSGIKDGTKSISDLRPSKAYMLDCGVITDFRTGKEVTIDNLCTRFAPGKDTLLPISYTAYTLPAEHSFKDPTGEILQQIIDRFPEVDDKDFRQLIEDCEDLRETEFYKSIEGKI